MGEQRGFAPLLTVDLAPVTVELNLRESGARFPCKWSSVLEIYKLERRLVLQIIDAKDRIAEETSIDSFIAGFELAWKLSVELNHYENERSVSCQTAMGSGTRFASKEEEK